MTDTLAETADTDELLDELRTWLEENWDPDLTVAEWWERLGTSGWAAPTLPADSFGKGVARSVGVQVTNEIAAFGAVGAPYGLGLLLAAPTIAETLRAAGAAHAWPGEEWHQCVGWGSAARTASIRSVSGRSWPRASLDPQSVNQFASIR